MPLDELMQYENFIKKFTQLKNEFQHREMQNECMGVNEKTLKALCGNIRTAKS